MSLTLKLALCLLWIYILFATCLIESEQLNNSHEIYGSYYDDIRIIYAHTYIFASSKTWVINNWKTSYNSFVCDNISRYASDA